MGLVERREEILKLLISRRKSTVPILMHEFHVSEKTILFAVGAVLFFVSDMLLGIWDYKCEKRAIANLNWITYFCGTMSIALSLWF